MHRAANTSALVDTASGPQATAVADGVNAEFLNAEFMAIKNRIERHLQVLMPASMAGPRRLFDAMQYSLLSPAKRARVRF